MFEKAKWITRTPWTVWGFKNPKDLPPAPYITKDFTIRQGLKSATLNIVSLGQGAYYLNGKRMTEACLPTQPTDPVKTVAYNVYDITTSLRVGNNRFGIILLNDRQQLPEFSWVSCIKTIMQLDIVYTDGKCEQIVSDTSFKTADSPILFNEHRRGEVYDARLEIPNWCDPNFENSDWDSAVITSGPGGIYREVLCEPIRVIKKIPGVLIPGSENIYDFGGNTSGWALIKANGKRGSEIRVIYSELLNEDKTDVYRDNILDGDENHHIDRYIMSGEKDETWEQISIYHGFRYIKILGEYDDIEVFAVVAYTDLPVASHFECDCEMLNKIHEISLNSLRTNCHGVITDCPHREQNPWTGDAMASSEIMNTEFFAYNFFNEWMHDFKDEQYQNGHLSSIVPTGSNWPRVFAMGPDWDSAMIYVPYYTYKYSGNREIIDFMWDNMNRTLNYFETLSENELLNCGLGDWNSYSKDYKTVHQNCPVELSSTCYYRIDSLMMAELASSTGRDPKPYLELADRIKNTYREKYISDGKVTVRNESCICISAFAKMYEEDEEKAEIKNLSEMIEEQNYQIYCGVHGIRTIFDLLSRHGYDETIFKILTNDSVPGFAGTVAKGLNTLPENFFRAFFGTKTSYNHHYFSHVCTWFYKGLAGINLNGFGFENIRIEPKFVTGVNRVKADMHGISVEYDEKEIKINSPYDFTFIFGNEKKKLKKGSYSFAR